MEHSILHITDLHLDDYEGTEEHLRRAYYEEYIDELILKINKSSLTVNTIIISGDLVNKGKVENFENVGVVIDYLANKLNVKKHNICFCIGNHDFKFKEEKDDGTNSIEVRKPYSDFIKNYSQNIKFENQRITLTELENRIFYLSIDSTLGSHEPDLKGKPGKITQREIDEIIKDILKKYIPENSLLMIGCHYPILSFPSGLAGEGEDNWEEKHLWKNANALRTRINKLKSISKIWFMGDCHIPDHIEFEDAYFIMTGRFGGTTKLSDIKYVSQIPRQCKILSFNKDSENFPVHTFSFEPITHKDNPNYGSWTLKVGDIRTIKPKEVFTNIENKEKDILKLINKDTEEMIISRILEYDLYSFGRFVTSEKNTSLGWVNINQLLNSTKLFSNIVSKSLKHINEQINLDFSESIIIGLDFWGTIIGSQISVGTGMKNFALPTRGNGKYHSNFESSNKDLEEQIKKSKEILFFIDVISCGDTLNRLVQFCLLLNSGLTFHVISIISNNSTIKEENFSKIKSAGTFCEKLKIPVLKNEELPSEEFLPANINIGSKK